MRAAPLLLLVLLAGCSTFPIPKEYVPDSKVVYLVQKTGFGPISYPRVAADPYRFFADTRPVDGANPTFLKTLTWETLLKADFQADARLYREVEAHLGAVEKLPAFVELRGLLDRAAVPVPPPLAAETGERVKEYSNGGLYAYPGAPSAQITVLDNGYYEIVFADKGYFRYQPDGTYERADAKGKILFASYPGQRATIATEDGFTYTMHPDQRQVSGTQGELLFITTPIPQYQYTSKDGAKYTLFVDASFHTTATALFLKSGLRVDFFAQGLEHQGVLVTKGAEAVSISPTFEKVHSKFDTTAKKATDVLSWYLPEGLRLTNFEGPGPAYAEVKAAWPEGYKVKTIGPFDVLYVAKDEALVGKLKSSVLAAVEANDRRVTGLSGRERRTLLIPPDLESYRKLNVSEPGETLNWYPSGFAVTDLIVMWPISVPRYDAPEGQAYFFDQEFYEILTHEYVHILVGENSGLVRRVPVWLNEGLAVYVESLGSPEAKAYWDLTFVVSQGTGRLLDWDTVTTTSTGELEIGKARVHYAQSYAFVKALMEKYGAAKVAAYVRSFRSGTDDLVSTYRTRFQQAFGVPFVEALKLLDSPKKP